MATSTPQTQEKKRAAQVLAEATGRSVEDFSAEEYEIPSLDDLESVPRDEWD